uniref:Uncharacterized protein n=1 Tax=Anguilla anguilla TaxID=7936 RepID=A0A0E9PB03_ANGAN
MVFNLYFMYRLSIDKIIIWLVDSCSTATTHMRTGN